MEQVRGEQYTLRAKELQPAGLVTDLKEARQRGSVYSRDLEQVTVRTAYEQGQTRRHSGDFIHGEGEEDHSLTVEVTTGY